VTLACDGSANGWGLRKFEDRFNQWVLKPALRLLVMEDGFSVIY
jgi:hypothetical protein